MQLPSRILGSFSDGFIIDLLFFSKVWSLEQPAWTCKIDEGSAGLIDVCWSPDSRHILTTADFHVCTNSCTVCICCSFVGFGAVKGSKVDRDGGKVGGGFAHTVSTRTNITLRASANMYGFHQESKDMKHKFGVICSHSLKVCLL